MSRQLLPSRFLIQRRPAALEAIRRHYCDFGCSPTFAELAARIGVEVHHVGKLLRQLVKRSEIGWTPGKARSITLPRPLSNYSNSTLLRELQERGLLLSLGPTNGVVGVIASVWPDAAAVDVAKVEHDLLAELDNIPSE